MGLGIPIAALGVSEYFKRKKRKKAGKGLDEMIKDLQAQMTDAQQPPVPPELGMLTQPQSQQMQQMIDRARTIQGGQSNQAGFNYLQQVSDPAQATQRGAAALDLQQAQGQQSASEKLLAMLSGGDQLPPGLEALSDPLAQQALATQTPAASGASVLREMGVSATDDPSSVREYKYMESLTPAGQNRYLNMKRGGRLKMINGVPFMADPSDPNKLIQLMPATDIGQLGADVDITKAESMRLYAAQLDMPELEDDEQYMTSLFANALKHPGLDASYGKSSLVPALAGSDRSNFEAIREQVQGKAFLQAFDTLKGGGQITEMEGRQATAAITRIVNSGMSDEAAREAWKELRDIIGRGFERKRMMATTRFDQSGPVPNPATQQIDDAALLKKYGL